MSTNNAFQGSDSLKQKLLKRLHAHQQAGHIVADKGMGAWDGSQGSPSGCTVEGNIELYQAQVGAPKSLTWLYDWMYIASESAGRDEFVLDWLRNIKPGSDLSAVESTFVLWLLSGEHGVSNLATSLEVGASLRRLVALHQRLLSGDAPTERQWQDFREQSVTITDCIEDQLDGALCYLIETLAWPAGSSFNLLSDGLSAWQWVHDIHLTQGQGWNDEYDRRLEAIEEAAEKFSAIGDNCHDGATFDTHYAQLLAEAPDLARIVSLRDRNVERLTSDVRKQLLECLSAAA